MVPILLVCWTIFESYRKCGYHFWILRMQNIGQNLEIGSHERYTIFYLLWQKWCSSSKQYGIQFIRFYLHICIVSLKGEKHLCVFFSHLFDLSRIYCFGLSYSKWERESMNRLLSVYHLLSLYKWNACNKTLEKYLLL